jgi:Family of unknown function (DUF5677)
MSATVAAMSRKPRRRSTSSRGPKAGRLPGPKRRLSRTFETLKDAAATGDAALSQPVPAGDDLARFDRGILLRGVNALKSARLLLEAMHWEFAAGPARQLFELLVNLEHLNAHANREQAAFRFAKFGLLQTLRAQLQEADYERSTGRPVDEKRVAAMERMLATGYDEFRVGKEKQRFASSWSGNNTRKLAEASPVQPLRKAQYQQLFVTWSEQLHAAPGSLMDAFFPRPVDAIDEMVEEDDKRVAETGAMCVTLFAELWGQLRTVASLDVSRIVRWQTSLAAEARSLGAPDPKPVASPPTAKKSEK